MAITKDEMQKEYFIIFLDKEEIEYVCKYKPLVSIDLIKCFIEENKKTLFDGKDTVKELLDRKYIDVKEDPSARFLVVKL